jgi:hypothetical protein
MKKIAGLLILLFLVTGCKRSIVQNNLPIGLHPENPHYFNYRGEPLFLITSDQHYGAVINLDFDYVTFLDTLAAYGMNFTRIYPGGYIEKDGEYMQDNVLGARNGRQILPWERSSVPGAHEVLGGFKFDLDRWNDAYFARLKDFLAKAEERNIIVDVAFFNGMYPDRWEYQALYHQNNIQGVGTCVFNMVQTLTDSALVSRHEAYVKKISSEINDFDNVILDICDEPFQDGCPPELYGPWISRLIDAILGAESTLPKKHIIMQTIDSHTRGGPGDFSADSRVRALANEYTWGIKNLDSEYIHEKPMVLIETCYYPHYRADKISASRVEAWEFLVGGGAAFMHLNGLYSSFNAGAAGTENRNILLQYKILKDFIGSFRFVSMRRDTALITGGIPDSTFIRAISEPGKQYAMYMHHSKYSCWYWEPMQMGACYEVIPGNYREKPVLNIAPGTYHAQWVDPATGNVIKTEHFSHDGGERSMETPVYHIDIVLKITKAN